MDLTDSTPSDGAYQYNLGPCVLTVQHSSTVESTLRTMNNLLERLHASFFFYILTTPSSFLKIGSYLPSVVLVAVSLMLGGLREWVNAGWMVVKDEHMPPEKEKAANVTLNSSKKKWIARRRDLLGAFMVVVASHLVGLSIFVVICGAWLDTNRLVCPSAFSHFEPLLNDSRHIFFRLCAG
jgi:maltodextrin utilization protein YvdJ